MTQAVEGEFAGPYAGGAKVPGVRTAGKSGTAELAPGERAPQLVHGLRARG